MNTDTIRLMGKVVPMPGYPPGMGQPALRLQVSLDLPRLQAGSGLDKLDALFAELLGAAVETDAKAATLPAGAGLLQRFLRWNRAVQAAAGWPAFTDGYLVAAGDPERSVYVLLVPCLSGGQRQAARALGWAVTVTNLALAGAALDEVREQLPKLLQAMGRVAPQGMNTLRFLQAAHEAGIPWRRVQGNVYQFGWGSRAHWLDSSFTEKTSRIGSVLARNKLEAAAVLRQSGIPVPDHIPVRNADEAESAAARLGYPVVVKPVDRDGGAGVMPGLRDAAAVRAAYAEARKLSAAVMVEKQVEGNDYRLQVFRSEVIWASHRVPGGVTGDGKVTVTKLLAALNADPRRGPPGSRALLKRIELDAEARELLDEQGLKPKSVPVADRFVRLRRAANVASGGVPVPVLEQVHPDNLALAARAARALRLDLAGIDLLIPDIAISWLESGAAICEVNAQPQLWPTLPAMLLKRLVKGKGRIPVIVVLGSPAETAWASQLAERIGSLGGRVGLATREGVSVAGATIVPGPCDVLAGGATLLLNPDVDLAMLCLDDLSLAQSGLPCDRFDLLILAGELAEGEARRHWLGFARLLTQACQGPVLANAEHPEWRSLLKLPKGREIRSLPTPEITETVLRVLRRGQAPGPGAIKPAAGKPGADRIQA
jgi:cyanophycin synthetase